ncbi:MAG TPA: carboxypeptidase-like regulatory domain-containing protein [Acidobacteriota bacterium]
MKTFVITFIASLILLLLTCSALAQDPRGLIRGRVTDATGGIVVGTRVVAVNTETQTRASAETNAEGLYNIPFLLPGTYIVTAELPGFKVYSRSGVQVRVSETTDLNIQMELGEVTDPWSAPQALPCRINFLASTFMTILR